MHWHLLGRPLPQGLFANWHVLDWGALLPLTCVEELDLGFCYSLTELPAALSRMPCLRFLELMYCTNLAGGWQHLAGCSQLTALSLTGCIRLAGLQAELATPPALQVLYLDSSSTYAGFRHLAHLACLTHIGMLYRSMDPASDRRLQGSAADLAQDAAAAQDLAARGVLRVRQRGRMLSPHAHQGQPANGIMQK